MNIEPRQPVLTSTIAERRRYIQTPSARESHPAVPIPNSNSKNTRNRKPTEPNNAMERGQILVTDRAIARSAPSIRLAHLDR